MKKLLYIVLSTSVFFITSCKRKTTEPAVNNIKSTLVKYAKGFEIKKSKDIITLIVKNPYQNANKPISYTFSKTNKSQVKIPVQKLIATSTTHIPMLELLGEESKLVGFPHTKYVSSKNTRQLIDQGKIVEIGQEAELNTEVLFDLQPNVVLAFSMQKTNKSLSLIEKNGIPVILNGDWLEETPLGRAEWIKVFGILFDKEKEADSIFSIIESNYLDAKNIALKAIDEPSILSGAVMQKDIWNLPAGDSFVAKYLKDANTNYLWENTTGKGSLSLSFESVLDKGQQADIWIAPGYFNTKEQLLQSNELYKQFDAFKNNKIYTPNLKTGATGGVIYYELGPTRPDLVLKDIIKIAHPDLLKEYEMTFFEKMK